MAPGLQEAGMWKALRMCGEAGVPGVDEQGHDVELTRMETATGGHVIVAERGDGHRRVVDLETAVDLNQNWVAADLAGTAK